MAKRKRKPKKSFRLRQWLKKVISFVNKQPLFVALLVFGLVTFLWIFKDLPLPTRLGSFPFPASTLILDREGKLLYEIFAEKNRVPIKLEELPDHLKKATIASEDKDFYKHRGFAWRGMARAVYNILFKHTLQGGSTITQQLVKNALLTPERTLRRKIREATLAYLTEILYSKDQILEMYFNQVPYGGTAWGIEAAAQTYFAKPARELTLAESALLAGLPVSPTRLSPFGAHPELAKGRQERVLKRMVEDGFITEQESERAREQELEYAPSVVGIKAPHFVLWVKERLVENYGEKKVEQGGLRVTTTLDLDLQNFAQETVASEVAELKNLKVSNGAALVTNPKTGEILAMVGSQDYFNQDIDGNVNLTLRPRQPGSSIKPINYALALERHLISPATVLNDVPTCFRITGQPLYCPVNYDGQFHGPTQVRFALGSSYNLPAVKVLALNGIEAMVAKATEMGISGWNDPSHYGLSLTLGGGEVTMHDMAQAYSAFATLGVRQDLWAIKKVEDFNGKTLFEQPQTEGPRVLPMAVAYLIDHILLDNNARTAAFGPSSWLVVKNHPEVSVKTGTTNDLRDNWTIGWTPSVMVVTWVGNNDNSPMSYVASGVTGASPIWNKIVSQVLADRDEEWPLKPEDVIGGHVCNISGKQPRPDEPCQTRFEYFFSGTVPAETEALKQFVEIDNTTGRLATDKTPPENRELQEKLIVLDALGTKFCLDCIFPDQALVIDPLQLTPQSVAQPTSMPE